MTNDMVVSDFERASNPNRRYVCSVCERVVATVWRESKVARWSRPLCVKCAEVTES